MGTIAEKLNYTLDAKSSIKNSIINKGVAMPDATPLGEYGSYINSIQTGGGGGGGGGDTPAVDLCDDIEEPIWVDTNNVIYVNDTNWPNTRSFVVPIKPGHTYSVKSKVIGDRERITLSAKNPLGTAEFSSYSGTRLLNNTSSPVVGYETLFTADKNENYLIIFCSTYTPVTAEYTVYELTSGGGGGGGSQVTSCGISANVVNLLDLYTLSNNDLSIKCSILDTYYSEKVDICDNVPRQIYTSGTTVYCNHSSYPTRKSFVVPIQPGRTYIVKSNAVGNKESITLCSNNPLEVTDYRTFEGVRNIRDVNYPNVGFETIFTAADDENYLVIYYTTDDGEANYSVYTYQRRQ